MHTSACQDICPVIFDLLPSDLAAGRGLRVLQAHEQLPEIYLGKVCQTKGSWEMRFGTSQKRISQTPKVCGGMISFECLKGCARAASGTCPSLQTGVLPPNSRGHPARAQQRGFASAENKTWGSTKK